MFLLDQENQTKENPYIETYFVKFDYPMAVSEFLSEIVSRYRYNKGTVYVVGDTKSYCRYKKGNIKKNKLLPLYKSIIKEAYIQITYDCVNVYITI